MSGKKKMKIEDVSTGGAEAPEKKPTPTGASVPLPEWEPETEKPAPGTNRVQRTDGIGFSIERDLRDRIAAEGGGFSMSIDSITAEGTGETAAEAFADAAANAKVVNARASFRPRKDLRELATSASYVPEQAAREAIADFDPLDQRPSEEIKRHETVHRSGGPPFGYRVPSDHENGGALNSEQRDGHDGEPPPGLEVEPPVEKNVQVPEIVARRAGIPEAQRTPVSEGHQVLDLPIDALTEGPNYRREYGDLQPLAESIKNNGLQSPILVRPTPAGTWEIVYGYRRFRAAKLAGLKTIAARVRELTDAQALEEALVENGQRLEATALEESEAFARLHREFSYTVDQIAARTGKSKATVYARLKLVDLCAEGKTAMGQLLPNGAPRLNHSIALLIARVPSHKLQAEAVAKIIGDEEGVGALSVREAIDLVRDTYTTELRGAPFDTKDALLVPEVGACTTCPKRSGNNPDLFSDLKRADVCTDTVCFKDKCDAAWQLRKEKAEAKGQKTLPPAEGRKIFKHGPPTWNSPWLELDTVAPDDKKKRTWRELLFEGKVKPEARPAVHVTVDDIWKSHEVVKRDQALQALAAAGVTWAEDKAEEEAKAAPASSPEEKKRREFEQQVLQNVEEAVVAKAVAAVEAAPTEHLVALDKAVPTFVLRMMAIGLTWNQRHEEILQRRGFSDEKGLQTWIEKKATPPQLLGLVFEASVRDWACGGYSAEYSEELRAMAKAFKIDLKAIEKSARTSLEAEQLFDQKKPAKGETDPEEAPAKSPKKKA